MSTRYFPVLQRWGLILFVTLSLVLPTILYAKVDTIYVTASSKNTGTVFSDGTFLQTSLIRIGQTSDYGGKVSGGWARFNVSDVPVGSTINSIKLYYYINSVTSTGCYADLMQMSNDPLLANGTTIWNDINDGNIYKSHVQLFSSDTITLATSANTDLQNQLFSHWFAIGFRYNEGDCIFLYGWDNTACTQCPPSIELRPCIVVDYTAPPPLDAYESDNSWDQARQLALNTTANAHTISPIGDQDWIYFDLNVRSGVTIETNGVDGGDTQMWLYDSSLTQLAYDDDGGNGHYSKITCNDLFAGRYYVKIDGKNNTIADYRIILTGASIVPQQTTVHGVAQYVDRYGVPQPIRYAYVKIMDGNNVSGDTILATTYTLSDGTYSAVVTNYKPNGLDLFVKVMAGGGAGAYPGTTSYITAVKDSSGNVQFHKSSINPHNVMSDLIFNLNDANIRDANNTGGAFSVYDSFVEGFTKVYQKFGLQMDGIIAYWPDSTGTNFNSIGNIPQNFRILQGDRWDRDVILHEYGHYVACVRNFAQGDVGTSNGAVYATHKWNQDLRFYGADAQGNDILLNPPRTLDQAKNLAFRESWATFFGMALQYDQTHNSVYHDLNDLNDMPPDNYYPPHDLEEDTKLNASITYPGEYNEALNACALWDMFDNNSCSYDNNDQLALGFSAAPYDKMWLMPTNAPQTNQINNYWDRWFSLYNTNARDITRIFIDHRMSFIAQPVALLSPANGTVQDTVVHLSWKKDSIAASYDVYYKIHTDANFIRAGNTIDTVFNLSGLASSRTYDWQIISKDGKAEAESAVGSFNTKFSGTLQGYNFWNVNEILLGNVYVPPGVQLTIAPNVMVNFNGYSLISTGGTITIQGGGRITLNQATCIDGGNCSGTYEVNGTNVGVAWSGIAQSIKGIPPPSGFIFYCWNDGPSDNPRTVASDINVTAQYKAHLRSSAIGATAGTNTGRKVAIDIYGYTTHAVYNSGGCIWYTRQNTDKTWTPEIKIGDGRNPSIAVTNPVNNVSTIHVVWENSSGNYQSRVYYRQSTDGGVTWQSTVEFDGKEINGPYDAAPIVFGNYAAVVVWRNGSSDAGGGLYAVYEPNGANIQWQIPGDFNNQLPSGSEINYSYYSNNLTNRPAGYNLYHLVFKNGTTGSIIYKKLVVGSSMGISDSTTLSSTSGNTNPVVACDAYISSADGTVGVAWENSTNHQVYYKESTNDGSTWGTVKAFTHGTDQLSQPVVGFESMSNSAIVLFQDNNQIGKVVKDLGSGTWSPVMNLGIGTGASLPSFTNNSPTALWVTGSSSPFTINTSVITILPTPTLSSPTNGTINVSTKPTLKWNSLVGAASYWLQVATDTGFASLVVDQTGINDTACSLTTALTNNTTYYWHVNAADPGGDQSSWSYTWKFTTVPVPIYTISGYVGNEGGGLSGVVMSGLPLNPVTNSSGSYTATVSYGWSGTVIPTLTGYTFNPSSQPYSNVTSNQVTNYTANIQTFTISGYVGNEGGGISGVMMSGLPGNPSTNSSGNYTARVNYNWSGTVTPTKTGYTFNPASQTYNPVTSNQVTNYTANIQTFTISGYVGNPGGATSGVMMSGLPGNPSTNSSGNYTARVNYNWSGTVTPTKTGYTFNPASQTYNPVTSNQVTNYTANIQIFTITASAGTGGSISPSGTITVNYGGNQSFTITPKTGYHISNVVVDGASKGAIGSYTFSNVTANHSISATFAIGKIAISLSQNNGSESDYVPDTYNLYQNYPNPFNPSTTIQFDLHNTTKVILKIYDISGKEIQTLVNCDLAAGSYTIRWNGQDANGRNVHSGMYFYRLSTEMFSATKKMMLLR